MYQNRNILKLDNFLNYVCGISSLQFNICKKTSILLYIQTDRHTKLKKSFGNNFAIIINVSSVIIMTQNNASFPTVAEIIHFY